MSKQKQLVQLIECTSCTPQIYEYMSQSKKRKERSLTYEHLQCLNNNKYQTLHLLKMKKKELTLCITV